MVENGIYIPLCMNCGLAVAPWFYTKAMRPVVAFLRALGHRVFAYLDEFFEAARAGRGRTTTDKEDTQQLGSFMRALFGPLGLLLHPHKFWFKGETCLEILGIVVDTRRQQFLLSPQKLGKLELAARWLLPQASRNRRHVRARDIRRFAGLVNAASPRLLTPDCVWTNCSTHCRGTWQAPSVVTTA